MPLRSQSIRKYLNPLIKYHDGTNHATALRALAALSVVLIHYDGFGTRESFPEGSIPHEVWNFLINLGIYGPTVFFIASGFALTASLSKGKLNLLQFFIRRVFRIWPLYICILLFYILFQEGFRTHGLLTTDNFILKALLLDVFVPKYFYDDPVGVLATLPIEFWWSLLMPIIVFLSRRFGILAEITIGLGTLFLNLYLQDAFLENSYLQSYQINQFWKYGFCFYLGYIAFRVRVNFPLLVRNIPFVLIVCPSIVIIEIFDFDLILNIYIATFLFLVMFNFGAVQRALPTIGEFAIALGTVCYSIYLLHNPIRQVVLSFTKDVFLLNVTSLLLLFILSPLTYNFIEKRGIRFGEKLYKRLFSES